jgi:hypothetical protein
MIGLVRVSAVLHDVWQGLRYASRVLGKQHTFTLAIVFTLALGVGASTAMFIVVEGVLLRPLPYPHEDRIVRVAATTRGAREEDRGNHTFSPRGYWHVQAP